MKLNQKEDTYNQERKRTHTHTDSLIRRRKKCGSFRKISQMAKKESKTKQRAKKILFYFTITEKNQCSKSLKRYSI